MAYFVRRAGFFVLTLWAALTLNFIIPRLQPGDPAEAIVRRLPANDRQVDPNQLKAVRLMLGLDTDQTILEQYFAYLQSLARGEFGVSYSYFPYTVTHMIGETLSWTLTLIGVTTIIGFVVGTLLGAWAAWRHNSATDSFITLGSTFLGTLPFFFVALLFLYVFAFQLRWFPEAGGYGGGVEPGFNWPFLRSAVEHSVLPAAVLLMYGPIGWILGMRNQMVQHLGADYTRLARAKGLSPRRIALWYGARVAILPQVTGLALAIGGLVGGSVIVEGIFSYPGTGRLMLDALRDRDFPLMQALFLFTICGVLLANLVADLLYGLLDPRVRRGG